MGKESAENVHCRAENTGGRRPSLSHGQIRFPHRFIQQLETDSDEKTDFERRILPPPYLPLTPVLADQ